MRERARERERERERETDRLTHISPCSVRISNFVDTPEMTDERMNISILLSPTLCIHELLRFDPVVG